MKLSYGICVCNEDRELYRLLGLLQKNKRDIDEIIVVLDEENTTPEVHKVLTYFPEVQAYKHKLNKNFAEHKNFLNSKATGTFMINLDADEFVTEEFIQQIPAILEENKWVDLFYVGRINTVSGIGLSYVQQCNWRISKLETHKEAKVFDLETEFDEYNLLKQCDLIIKEEDFFGKTKVNYYTPIINAFDPQPRIYRLFPTIYWSGIIHEGIVGVRKMSQLPYTEPYCILHYKTLNKQIKQNEFYQQIAKEIK